jgi:hypothetical protein
MTVYVLTKASPTATAFTLAERTTVQFCILGSSVIDGNSRINLDVDKGGSVFDWYKITVDDDAPMNVDLAAGTYRISLYTEKDNTNYVVSMLPNAV